MRIDNTNIEEVLFDYVEGNLSNQDSTSLFKFLDKNPQYQSDLDAWQATMVQDSDELEYNKMDSLFMTEKVAIKKPSFYKYIAIVFFTISLLGFGYLCNVDTPVNYNARIDVPQVIEFEKITTHTTAKLNTPSQNEFSKVLKAKSHSPKTSNIEQGELKVHQSNAKVYLSQIISIPARIFSNRHNTVEKLNYRQALDGHIYALQEKVDKSFAKDRKRKMKLRTIIMHEKRSLGKQKDVVPMDQFGF
jgi:hypothetical protein